MEDKVLDFIHRRFPEDCHWTDGNCYWFAKILCERFAMELCYDSVPGHFVAQDRMNGRVYDWKGLYEPESDLIPMWKIYVNDPKWYRRLVRDCVE